MNNHEEYFYFACHEIAASEVDDGEGRLTLSNPHSLLTIDEHKSQQRAKWADSTSTIRSKSGKSKSAPRESHSSDVATRYDLLVCFSLAQNLPKHVYYNYCSWITYGYEDKRVNQALHLKRWMQQLFEEYFGDLVSCRCILFLDGGEKTFCNPLLLLTCVRWVEKGHHQPVLHKEEHTEPRWHF